MEERAEQATANVAQFVSLNLQLANCSAPRDVAKLIAEALPHAVAARNGEMQRRVLETGAKAGGWLETPPHEFLIFSFMGAKVIN